jgi:hypothetical protein
MYVLNLYENMKVICMEQDCITVDVWINIYLQKWNFQTNLM